MFWGGNIFQCSLNCHYSFKEFPGDEREKQHKAVFPFSLFRDMCIHLKKFLPYSIVFSYLCTQDFNFIITINTFYAIIINSQLYIRDIIINICCLLLLKHLQNFKCIFVLLVNRYHVIIPILLQTKWTNLLVKQSNSQITSGIK